ncbi:MAG: SDR family oxidoreductase [Gammaproteobacteria bacterium]|nr:SDR family oxidoreductase [Gammaproteobacteria bacterium]
MTQKVVLITGASRGIGAACAVLAAEQGWRVVVNYQHHQARAEEVVAKIRAQGGSALALAADVGDEAQVLALYQRIDEEFGVLHALVNNAGVVDQPSRVDALTAEQLDRMWRINLTGSFLCAREAIKRMSTHRGKAGGSIVNMSSAAARLGSPNLYVHYAASKGAIDTFTLGLAKEVSTEGIRVNAIRPGLIDTEIHASGGLPNRAFELAPQVPMQRPGRAEEVAQAVVWLMSDSASYVTGALLDVSGGR